MCLSFSPERLPHYVRAFSRAIGEQMYRYADVPHPDGQYHGDAETDDQSADDTTGQQPPVGTVPEDLIDIEPLKTTLTEEEQKQMKELTVVNVALKPQNTTVSY